MATTIKTTALDFESIKNNLKTFLAQKPEFSDYNFEAAGISNLLDVLAYNTHYNGLIANFALNEAFMGTAQLRSSLVSLSEGIGYIPDSRTASRAVVNLSLNLAGVGGRPNTISYPAGLQFNCAVNNTTYVFQTIETIFATDNGSGVYNFQTSDGSIDILIYEGTSRQKTFLVGPYNENTVYVIPDKLMDISTAIVRVYDTPSSQFFTTYTDIQSAITINEQSSLYVLREAPNEYFELTFGNGTTLGRAPESGNKITVDYLAPVGPDANGGSFFIPKTKATVSNLEFDFVVTTINPSAAGAYKEGIESIRQNAPFQYAAQNRMVTANDYSSLVLRNFSSLIKDIQAWGGEDNPAPQFGAVYMSVLFNDNVPQSVIDTTKASITDLASQLSVVSFDLVFEDPLTTYVETSVYYQFNPRLTTIPLNGINDQVQQVINNYFMDSVGRFQQSFRRSNLLALIDDVSPAVLSSRAEVKMQQRVTPRLNAFNDFNLTYPTAIVTPQPDEFTVSSTSFTFNNQTCVIRNKLNTNKLQVVSLDDNSVQVDNVGTYTATTGVVNIVGLAPQTILGGANQIKVSVIPANASAISPSRNNILVYDPQASFATGVIVSTQ